MSWQAYVDQTLIGSHKVDKAAIFSAAGDSVWATSAGFTVSPAELKEVLKGYNAPDPDDVAKNPLWASGFHIAGHKYMTIKADARSVYGKKGKEGVLIVKTKQALVVAHYPETVLQAEAVKVAEQLGDYLIGVGY